MARKNQDIIQELTLQAQELASALQEAASSYQSNLKLTSELHELYAYAEIIADKLPRLAKLRDWNGYRYAILQPDGELREASTDEIYRLIMNYQRGDVLSIIRNWTVDENGQWQKITPDE